MQFLSIEEVIELTGINAKEADVLGRAGAFCNLQEELNEIEASQYAKEMVSYLRDQKRYIERIEKYQETLQKRDALFRERVEARRKKTEERRALYEKKIVEWKEEVERRKEINERREAKGIRLLKIPPEPPPPKPLAEISPIIEGAAPTAPQKPIQPRTTLSQRERVKLQRDTLNMYLTGHPLDDVSSDPEVSTIRSLKNSVESLSSAAKEKELITIRGVLLSHKIINLRSKQLMARLRIEDKTGSIEVVAFPSIYKSIQELLEEGKIFKILGKVDRTTSFSQEGNEQVHVQFKGLKFSIVRVGSDKDWDIKYPLLKGSLRILPGSTEQSKGKAVSIIMQHTRE